VGTKEIVLERRESEWTGGGICTLSSSESGEFAVLEEILFSRNERRCCWNASFRRRRASLFLRCRKRFAVHWLSLEFGNDQWLTKHNCEVSIICTNFRSRE